MGRTGPAFRPPPLPPLSRPSRAAASRRRWAWRRARERRARFVRTVGGFGYAFASSAEADGLPRPGAGWLWLETDAGSQALADGENVLRREGRLVTRVEGPGVSQRHARTFPDGERVTSLRALQDGALIRLGRLARLVFRDDAADPTETESSGS